MTQTQVLRKDQVKYSRKRFQGTQRSILVQPLVALLCTAASLRILPQHYFIQILTVWRLSVAFSYLQAFVWVSHTFKMHTRTCSHLLLLTYVSRNTHTHISAACGWHPQCCKTSYIPHAYITPFPPPPADHSSFYPAFALSHSLLLSLKSVWLAPSAHKQNFCYTQFMKGHIPTVRSG